MNIIRDINTGDLRIKATRKEREQIRALRRRLLEARATELEVEQTVIRAYFVTRNGEVYWQIKPEENGDLTDAPIITDGTDRWGFLDYQITSFIAELLCGRETFWTRAR